MSPFALAAAVWGVSLLGAGAVWLAWRRGGDRELRRRLALAAAPLAGPAAAEAGPASEESVFRPQERRRWLAGLWAVLEARYPLLDPPRAVAKGIGFGLAAGGAGWFSLWFLSAPSGWWTFPVLAAAGGLAGWYSLSWLHAHQVTAFIRQFPETVDQIARLATAGVPALEAINVAAEDTPAPAGPILRDVRDRLAAGLDADSALRAVAERVRIAEFTMFAAVIRLQRRSGGRVSVAFANLADTLRDRNKTALKVRASTAQTRVTLLILSVMPILVLVVQKFTAPDSVDMLFNTEEGTNLLRAGVALIVFGIFVARTIAARGQG